MFCSKCGFQNDEGTAFCQKCGNNLKNTGESTQKGIDNPKKSITRSSNPVISTVKEIASSPLFVTAIALFSIALFFDLISLIAGKYGIFGYIESLADKFGLGYETSELFSVARGFSSAISFIGMIPAIIITIGMWMIFASAIDRKNDSMKTSGFTMIKVISIIRLIFICALLLIIEIIFIFAMIQSSKNYSTLNDISSTASSIGSAGIGVLIALNMLTGVGFVIVILYYAKIIGIIDTVKKTIFTSNANDKISSFVAILTFISAGFTFISVFFGGGLLSILSTLCSVASMICFGILIFKYKNAMSFHLKDITNNL